MKPSAAPEKAGVLAARQAIPEAQHPRAPEPTAKSVLAGLDPAGFATVGEDATVFDALKIMAERDTSAVAVASPAGSLRNFFGAGPCAPLSAGRGARCRRHGPLRGGRCAGGQPATLSEPDEGAESHACGRSRPGPAGRSSVRDRSVGGSDRPSRTDLPRDRTGSEAAVLAWNLQLLSPKLTLPSLRRGMIGIFFPMAGRR